MPADSPVQNFFLARLGVEIPRIPFVYERYGRGPILRADIQDRGSIRVFHQTAPFLISLYEISAAVGVLSFIPADSPVQNFFLARLDVEIPRIPFVYERYGRGPI